MKIYIILIVTVLYNLQLIESDEFTTISSKIYFPINNISVASNEFRQALNDWEKQHPFHYDIARVKKIKRNETDPSKVFDFVSLVEKHTGYKAEEHTVESDGYKLILHRISASPNYVKFDKKPVVFIQHGLFMSSDCHVLFGPKKDLPFFLANAGFDVWLGNARGNTYSRAHDYRSPNDTDFWNFSFQEVGENDIGAFINKIISETNVDKLDFIGYQLGAAEGLIHLAKNTFDQDKIRLFISISPFSYWKDLNLPDTRNSVDYIKKQIADLNVDEIYPQSTFFTTYYKNEGDDYRKIYLIDVLSSFLGGPTINNKNIVQKLPMLMKYFPAGTSKKTVLHLLENLESGNFAEYSVGAFRSSDYYLSHIDVPVIIFNQSPYEIFVKEKDTRRLMEELPNVVVHSFFGDVISLWTSSDRTLYHNFLIDLLKRYETKEDN